MEFRQGHYYLHKNGFVFYLVDSRMVYEGLGYVNRWKVKRLDRHIFGTWSEGDLKRGIVKDLGNNETVVRTLYGYKDKEPTDEIYEYIYDDIVSLFECFRKDNKGGSS